MRFKDLFTVPAGQKVTEKHLRRVLASSICSILLCMTCLVSTTWAWFVVSIENTGNVIQLASGVPGVSVTNDENNEDFTSGSELSIGKYVLKVKHAGVADDLNEKSTLYVTFSVDNQVQGYVLLNGANGYGADVTVTADKVGSLSWVVSWFAPESAVGLLAGNEINLIIQETESGSEAADSADTTTSVESASSTESATSSTASVPSSSAEETSTPTGGSSVESAPVSSEASSSVPETSSAAPEGTPPPPESSQAESSSAAESEEES